MNNEPFSTGIDFVKINDPDAAHRFNILQTPALVYFRKKVPLVYDGERCLSIHPVLFFAVLLMFVLMYCRYISV